MVIPVPVGCVGDNCLPACPVTQQSVHGQIYGQGVGVAVWSYFWKCLLGVSSLGSPVIATDQAMCADTKSACQ